MTVPVTGGSKSGTLYYRVTVKRGGKVVSQVTGSTIYPRSEGGTGSPRRTPPGTTPRPTPPKTTPRTPEPPSAPATPTGERVTIPMRVPLPKIVAPALQDRTVFRLPGMVDDLGVGGGGRYILLQINSLRKIAVFDVNVLKIVNYIPLASDDSLFAASADKLIVVLRDQNAIQRWSLTTFEREVTTPVPEGVQVQAIAMGCASGGPLMILPREGPTLFMDIRKMNLVDVDAATIQRWRQNVSRSEIYVRASMDGSCYTAWRGSVSPSGLISLTIYGTESVARYEHTSVGGIFPGYDGSILYTYQGIFNSDLKAISQERFGRAICVPTYGSNYFLGITGVGYGSRDPVTVSVYSTSDKRLLYSMTNVSELQGLEIRGGRGGMSMEKLINAVPAAKLMWIMPSTHDQLILLPFDVVQAMDKAGIDYLFVTSTPVGAATTGEQYSYRLTVASKRGGVKYRLESGPEGMKIAADGLIQWKVPGGESGKEESVIISVTDASGQEIFHTFKVQVR